MRPQLPKIKERLRRLPEASFLTLLAPDGDFSRAEVHGTTFFLALTLSSLNAAPDSELMDLRQRLADKLRALRQPLGSWNYWLPSTPPEVRKGLPDDFDTTSSVLAALAAAPGSVPGEWLADIVRLLIQREVEAGGPYRTWLVGSEAAEIWQDVDFVVNANIGRALAHFGSFPPPLMAWLGKMIADKGVTSPYYADRLFFRYILAWWYRGENYQLLVEESRAALLTARQGGSLQTLAMALATASCFPEIELALLSQAADELDQRSAAEPMTVESTYIHGIRGEIKDHAGSPAFRLTVCHEALWRVAEREAQATRHVDEREQQIVLEARKHLAPLPRELAQATTATLDMMIATDTQKNLTLFPFRVAEAALGNFGTSPTALTLGAAHLFGWIAYTMLDDIVDGDAMPDTLWQANAFQRLSLQLFVEASAEPSWKTFCLEAMARMDTMNLVEQRDWRLVEGALPVKLPTVDLSYLTERSLGVLLAPTGLVVQIAGVSIDDPLVVATQNFLRHLIAARQLCDDAHDWIDDLAHGRLNSASVQLFGGGVALENQEVQQDRFWGTTIEMLTAQVREHCAAAREAAKIFRGSAEQRERFLQPLEESMEKAIRERNFNQQLLKAYRGV